MWGQWRVRCGDALAWVEAPSAGTAMRLSLDLARPCDWRVRIPKLVVFPPG